MARILVIDDVPGVRRSIVALLGRAGHEVREAADGKAGVEAARDFRPDVALVDMLMPEQDGIETLHALRADTLAAKCVAMSGGGSLVGAEDALSAAASHADATMQKPFESNELTTLIDQLTGKEASS